MALETVADVLAEHLGALRDAETHQAQAFSRLSAAAYDPALTRALRAHLGETRRHGSRLDWVIRNVDFDVGEVPHHAVRDLLRQADAVAIDSASGAASDLALIAVLQCVDHLELSGYRAALHCARLLFYGEAERLLRATLKEERRADKRLVKLAKGGLIRTGIGDQAMG